MHKYKCSGTLFPEYRGVCKVGSFICGSKNRDCVQLIEARVTIEYVQTAPFAMKMNFT